jgi:deaminated glutathione amidase
LSICYDLRFPELYRYLANEGSEILLIPAAFFKVTGEAVWHTLLKARAIENQCFVIAAAQYGKHNEKRESYGHSIVVDPSG